MYFKNNLDISMVYKKSTENTIIYRETDFYQEKNGIISGKL